MEYAPFLLIIVISFFYFLYKQDQTYSLKRDGVKVPGIIISNNEGSPNSRFRLGGNFNEPTIKFFTEENEEIIGKPVQGFTSQSEITALSEIFVIYDPQNPSRFCIDFDSSFEEKL